MSDRTYDYKYYIEGNQLAILEAGINVSIAPRYDAGNGIWVTPENNDTGAIMVEYSDIISAPASETDSMTTNQQVSLAVVDYVKHRLFEDAGEDVKAMRYYNRFLSKIYHERNSIAGSYRGIVASKPTSVL